MVFNIVWSSFAERRLNDQIDYLIDNHAPQAARRLEQRVTAFVNNTLARFPNSGRILQDQEMLETWIPDTKLVIWYRLRGDNIEIINLWHSSQDRQAD